VLLAAAAATGEFGQFDPAHVSAASWLALAYLIGPGFDHRVSAYVVASAPPCRRRPSPPMPTSNPIIAVILGTALLGEALTASMLVGGALIVFAVVLVVRSQAAARR